MRRIIFTIHIYGLLYCILKISADIYLNHDTGFTMFFLYMVILSMAREYV